MKRFVIMGTSGLLGRAWLGWLESQEDTEVISVGRTVPHGSRPTNAAHLSLDLTVPSFAVERIAALKPYAIIHVAGTASIEFNADPEKGAAALSSMGTTLAEASRLARSKAVLVSCDTVFDGSGPLPTEDAPPNPQSLMGKSLRAMEETLEQACDDRLILRTSMLYGWAPHRKEALLSRWITRWNQDQPVRVPVDVVGCPTWVDGVPKVAHALLRRDGVFHVAGHERYSLYDLAVHIARILELPADHVRGVSANEDSALYGPPFQGGLTSEKYRTIATTMPSLDQCLAEVSRQRRKAPGAVIR